MDYLRQLNEPQRKAVEHIEGPMMVIAGAGSGKTRVLTYRAAHLIEQGIDPFNILALTFTNKAAREMKARVASIVGTDAKSIWMGTFHSVFARILRGESEKIGYPKNFSIYDTTDSRNLIKRIVKEKGLDPKIYKQSSVHGRISAAKNKLISAAEYARNPDIQADDQASGKPELGKIFQEYSHRLFQAGAMDFDDLLFMTNILLRDFPEVLNKYQDQFQFLLVDEYQDTNFAQYMIIKKLAARRENICVVGDDAQSIYAFRGANIQNILNFKKDYPDHALYKLEQNYRSTQAIVNTANSLIAKNREQIRKTIWTSNGEGDRIPVYHSLTDNEEARKVTDSIYEVRNNKNAAYSDIAILYRTNAQSRPLEEALRKQNIPYRIYGGLSFYQRKEIKDLLAYFRLTINHHDEEALKRVINYPKRGLGSSSLEKAIVTASQHNVTLWQVLDAPQQFALAVNSGTRNKMEQFTTMIKSFATMVEDRNAYDLGQHIASSTGILKELYSDKTPEGISRYENIQELLNGMKEFTEKANQDDPDAIITLSDFLVDVALLTDADQDDGDNDRVSLMTVHSAKGLEFPYVFIVGLEENLFPSQMSLNSREDLEEERRLFYVALTRAEQQAFLSYSESRYKWGNLLSCEPSRFIEELDPQHLDMTDAAPTDGGPVEEDRKAWFGEDTPTATKKKNQGKPAPGKRRLTKVRNTKTHSNGQNSDNKDVKVGSEVEHQRFGKGKVLQLEGTFPDTKATVFFPNVGQKTLLLKFAKLTLLDAS